jgi:hypothetical protein
MSCLYARKAGNAELGDRRQVDHRARGGPIAGGSPYPGPGQLFFWRLEGVSRCWFSVSMLCSTIRQPLL